MVVDIVDASRLFNLVLCVVSLVIWTVTMIQLRERWAYAVPALFWTLNILVFTLCAELVDLQMIRINIITLNLWSTYLRSLSLIMVVGLAFVVLREGRYWHNKLK